MRMKKALILPYYGILPNYFTYWLQSAGYNKDYDFLIFTDIDLKSYSIPSNVYVYFYTLDQIKESISTILDFKFVLDQPYKLCDYRPLYGLIFSEFIKDYDVWGYCDSDIIMGNLSHFLNDDIFKKYDRVYCKGHMTFYKNNKDINEIALSKSSRISLNYKDIYQCKKACYYDEGKLIESILEENNYHLYNNTSDFADINTMYFDFRINNYEYNPTVFQWKEGLLFGYSKSNDDKIVKKEFSYVHLQKRRMQNDDIKNPSEFYIIPNEIRVNVNDFPNKYLYKNFEQENIKYHRKMKNNKTKALIKNIFKGSIGIKILSKSNFRNK